MCAGPFKPKSQPVARNEAAEAQQAEAKAAATEKAKTQKSQRLDESVSRMRGGTGRRSLIQSSRGGMGFYNEYMK